MFRAQRLSFQGAVAARGSRPRVRVRCAAERSATRRACTCMSAPTQRREMLAGDAAFPSVPENTCATPPRNLEPRNLGERAGTKPDHVRSRSGSAIHNCTPLESPGIARRRPLRVRDAVTGRHHVDAARAQRAFTAEAVVMDDLAVEQPGDGLQAHVRMRRDVHRRAFAEGERPEAIEKAPRPDQASAAQGQRALHTNRADRRPRERDTARTVVERHQQLCMLPRLPASSFPPGHSAIFRYSHAARLLLSRRSRRVRCM